MQLHCKVNTGVMLNYFHRGKSCPKRHKNTHQDSHKIGAMLLKVAKKHILIIRHLIQMLCNCIAFAVHLVSKEKERKGKYIYTYILTNVRLYVLGRKLRFAPHTHIPKVILVVEDRAPHKNTLS